MQITKEHLLFLEDATVEFERDPKAKTYRNEEETLIALRRGQDEDCVQIYELGREVAFFAQYLKHNPTLRESVARFARDMEIQLLKNEHKGGWEREHHQDMSGAIFYNTEKLRSELMKLDKDTKEITKRCANIANFAMMIAENQGEPL